MALRNIPRDSVRLHVCCGSYEGAHKSDVALEDILPILYDADVGALVLDRANPCHAREHKISHNYPSSAHLKSVAGVIDSKTNYVEHPEVVADRIGLAVNAI